MYDNALFRPRARPGNRLHPHQEHVPATAAAPNGVGSRGGWNHQFRPNDSLNVRIGDANTPFAEPYDVLRSS